MKKVEFIKDWLTYKKGETLMIVHEGTRWEFWKTSPSAQCAHKTYIIERLVKEKTVKIIS